MIPITKPSLDISDLRYIKKVIKSKILTDGYFQKKTEELIKKLINSKFVSLTQSCTAALEIASILINLIGISAFLAIFFAAEISNLCLCP